MEPLRRAKRVADILIVFCGKALRHIHRLLHGWAFGQLQKIRTRLDGSIRHCLRVKLVRRLGACRLSRCDICWRTRSGIQKSDACLVVAKPLFDELVRNSGVAIGDGTTKLCNSGVARLLGEVRINPRNGTRRRPLGSVTTEATQGIGYDLILSTIEEWGQQSLAGTIGSTNHVRRRLAQKASSRTDARIQGATTFTLPRRKRLYGTHDCACGRCAAVACRYYATSHTGAFEQRTAE